MRLTFPNQQEKIIHKEIVSQKQHSREQQSQHKHITIKKDHFNNRNLSDSPLFQQNTLSTS